MLLNESRIIIFVLEICSLRLYKFFLNNHKRKDDKIVKIATYNVNILNIQASHFKSLCKLKVTSSPSLLTLLIMLLESFRIILMIRNNDYRIFLTAKPKKYLNLGEFVFVFC